MVSNPSVVTDEPSMGFVGFKPIKQVYVAPVRKSAAKTRDRWLAKAEARGHAVGSR